MGSPAEPGLEPGATPGKPESCESMARLARIPLFSWGLGALTLIALLTNVPQTDGLDTTVWLFYAGLVALMLNLGTMLNEGVVSPASTAALMAYLTLGEARSADAALWCVTVGALTGNLVWLLRTLPTRHTPRQYARVIRSMTIGIAQMTLGLLIGGWAYRRLEGPLPLDRLAESDMVPLGALVAVYLAVYLGILFLEASLRRRRTPWIAGGSWPGGVAIVLLPLPFGIVGAVAYHEISRLAFVILIGGLLTIVAGVNLLNRTQARYRQQVTELSALSVISQAMRTNLDLDALLKVVHEQVTLLLGVQGFTVALVDPNQGTLDVVACFGDGRTGAAAIDAGERDLIERVVERKAALLLKDQVARRASELGLAPPAAPPCSWLGVPLLAPDRVLGCLAVSSANPERTFAQKDLHLLTTIAAQVGIAIYNAQLYHEAHNRAVQLATLNNVVALLSGTLDVQQVLDLVGSSAQAAANCDAVAVYMWRDGGRRALLLARHNGLSDTFAGYPIRPLMLDLDNLERRRQPILVSDVHTDQRTQALRAEVDREGKRAWAEYLLRKGDDLLGILVFFYNQPHFFSTEEIELLRNFTNQAALAISNARLYTRTDEALNRRVEQLSALAEISRELTSTLNLQGVFRLVLDRAIEATQSHNGLLMLRLDDDETPALVAYRGFAPGALDGSSPLRGSIARAYESGSPTLIPDVQQEAGGFSPDGETCAQLNVPITHGAEVLGVISLGSHRPDDYGPDDLAFVTQLAVQARIAIDNARLFRRIEIARDRLQVILDSMKEGVILISADGRITLANPRVALLLGLEPRRILQMPVATLLADPGVGLAERLGIRPEELLALIRSLETGRWDELSQDSRRTTFEVTASRRRFIDRTDAPVRDESGRVIGLLMVFSDVTEERELAQAREDLSSMIVHDLRGPLTAVTTSLKLLGEIAPSDDPLGRAVRQTTETSSRAVRKLLSLVDSLLDISKLESGVVALEREPADLQPLCTAVVDEMAPLAQELDVELVVRLPRDLPPLDIDADKIERVLLNLVDNAIKFTPSSGQVVIRAYPPGEGGAPPGFVRTDVCDTGPGVPDDYKERLFDRFAQLDHQRGRRRGTGLGLTFCRLTVEAHGGQIWVEDNPQGGAIFAFTLPVMNFEGLEYEE